VNFDRKAHPLQPRLDGVDQIPLHVGLVSGVLGRTRDRDESRQMIAETASVEIGQCARQGAISRCHITLLGWSAWVTRHPLFRKPAQVRSYSKILTNVGGSSSAEGLKRLLDASLSGTIT
jgi:hypothetical protein